MLTFHEALNIINEVDFQLATEKVKLTYAWNRILREDIISDINMPPFDKSAMDGFACRKQDLANPLKIIGTLYAGSSEVYHIEPGTCVKIMTGAPVPEGADTVIMIEHTKEVEIGYIQFTKASTKSNICKLGEDIRTGDKLLESGTFLLAHHVGILASAGIDGVKVSRLPRVAILSTGNELIEPKHFPKSSQIRNSNAYNLLSQLKAMSIHAYYDGIVADNKKIIHSRLTKLLVDHDLVILTGGASQGEHDYVPSILKEMGLDLKFEKLAIQPGKPVSFATGIKEFCFGLSGNPVSSYLQFELLVKPFLYHIMSHKYQHPIIMSELAIRMRRKNTDKLKFFPVYFNERGRAEELQFNGSAHITGLTYADGFGLFPRDCGGLEPGDRIEVLMIR